MRGIILAIAFVTGAATLTAAALAQSGNLVGEGEKPGQRLEVRDIKRDEGGTVTLRFQLINDGDSEINSCSLRDAQQSDNCGVVGAVHLIDAANKKKYLVVRDAQKKCVCSHVANLKKGDRSNAWAKFPAPPDAVQKITVVVPGFEPIEGVPITSR
jgi:hypothetical protein